MARNSTVAMFADQTVGLESPSWSYGWSAGGQVGLTRKKVILFVSFNYFVYFIKYTYYNKN